MTVKGGTTPACAACKYQRRRCTPTCPLAPYFPAHQPKMFQSVHRLFGVSNITKTLKSLQTKDQKEDAMKSIIFEAEMREKHPVHGCYGVTLQLHHHLNFALEELRCVYAQLAECREQMNKQMDNWDSSNLEFGTCSSADPNQFFVNESSNGFNGEYLDNNMMARPLLGLDPCSDIVSHNNLSALQNQMEVFGIQQERELLGYEGVPFNTTADDRQSYIENKEACESCSETSQKDTTQAQSMEHVSQSELRSAAAGFSLTTVN